MQFVASQLVGVVMARYILELEPFKSLPVEQIADTIAPNLQRYLTGELPRDCSRTDRGGEQPLVLVVVDGDGLVDQQHRDAVVDAVLAPQPRVVEQIVADEQQRSRGRPGRPGWTSSVVVEHHALSGRASGRSARRPGASGCPGPTRGPSVLRAARRRDGRSAWPVLRRLPARTACAGRPASPGAPRPAVSGWAARRAPSTIACVLALDGRKPCARSVITWSISLDSWPPPAPGVVLLRR